MVSFCVWVCEIWGGVLFCLYHDESSRLRRTFLGVIPGRCSLPILPAVRPGERLGTSTHWVFLPSGRSDQPPKKREERGSDPRKIDISK